MGACAGAQASKAAPVSDFSELSDYSGPGPWFACNPNADVVPRRAKVGVAGRPDSTLPEVLRKAAEAKSGQSCLLVERPVPALDENGRAPPALPREEWTRWTYQQYYDDVRCVSRAFIALGFQPFETVNVWGFNSPEWFICCMASTFCAGKVGGIYPTDTPEAAAFKIVHSGGSIVAVDDRAKAEKLAKALSSRGDAKRLKAFVIWEDAAAPPDQDELTLVDEAPAPPAAPSLLCGCAAAGAAGKLDVSGCGAVPVLSWRQVLDLGDQTPDRELSSRVDDIRSGHCAALIYTSGTTGDPKAVMLSHDTIVFECASVFSVMEEIGFLTEPVEERLVSYLPLSHVAGFLIDICSPIVAAATTNSWSSVFFSRPYDLKVGTIKDRLCVAKPTLFLGVPLVWEKFADRFRAVGAEGSEVQKIIGGWAKGLALDASRHAQLGGTGAVPLGHSVASSLLNKIKVKVGLDACKFGLTGAAPIRVDTLEYFGSLGLLINELYGMSECAGAATISTPQHHQWGSCGYAMPGVEVKVFTVDPNDINKKSEVPRAPSLDAAEEMYMGEICFRGRNVMMGYLANPDMGTAHVKEMNKKTAETIDKDGWLHSGDKGMVTVQGMFKITGRFKELIIGEGGENIAPVPIEDEVKKQCDGVAEVMMVGDHRKYNVAIVTLKAVGANGESPGTDQLDAGAKRLNPQVQTISQAMDDPAWIKAVTNAISAANGNSKTCPNNAFKIQKFTILPTNFSEQDGFLTPTKKLKRTVVEKHFAKVVDKMYATDGVYIRFEA